MGFLKFLRACFCLAPKEHREPEVKEPPVPQPEYPRAAQSAEDKLAPSGDFLPKRHKEALAFDAFHNKLESQFPCHAGEPEPTLRTHYDLVFGKPAGLHRPGMNFWLNGMAQTERTYEKTKEANTRCRASPVCTSIVY